MVSTNRQCLLQRGPWSLLWRVHGQSRSSTTARYTIEAQAGQRSYRCSTPAHTARNALDLPNDTLVGNIVTERLGRRREIMPEYNFSTLFPEDFEQLVCDLLKAKHDWDLEMFGRGPDGGVDLRAQDGHVKIVVQCKHYRGSTFYDLKRSSKNESLKMAIEKPDRYLFVTSQDLSKTRKDELFDTLRPWIKRPTDILCMKDINRLIDDFPAVEARHFKLWLASSEVLKRIVQSGIWERSEALMEEIQNRVKLYTLNPSYTAAMNLLSGRHVAVITGTPGVGKSMLADMLALVHWEAGWQIINLPSHEIGRCWDAWNKQTKQFFYFDDVFGQTDVAERLSRDSGTTVAQLISRVASNPNKRLVITTRTHILREAEGRDEPLQRARLKASECVVQVADYGFRQRARILYNHLYFSDQPRRLIQDFIQNGTHLEVIRHANFNPRIIEQVLLKQHHETSAQLQERIKLALDRPIMLWGTSFAEALSAPAQRILMQLATFPVGGAPQDRLRKAAIRDATPMDYTK